MLLQKTNLSTVRSIKCLMKVSNISNKVMSLMDFLYGRKENKTCFQVESFKFVFLISKYIWEIYFLNILQLNVLFFLLVIKYLIYLPIYLSLGKESGIFQASVPSLEVPTTGEDWHHRRGDWKLTQTSSQTLIPPIYSLRPLSFFLKSTLSPLRA